MKPFPCSHDPRFSLPLPYNIIIAMRSFSRRAVSRLLTQQNTYRLYLHEYQAYDLLKKYQVPLVPSFRASNPEDALAISQRVMASTTKNKPFVDIIVVKENRCTLVIDGYLMEKAYHQSQYFLSTFEAQRQLHMLSTSNSSQPSLKKSLVFTLLSSPSNTHISFLSCLLIEYSFPSRSFLITNFSNPSSIQCSSLGSSTPACDFSASQLQQLMCYDCIIFMYTHFSPTFIKRLELPALFVIFFFKMKTPSPTPQSLIQAQRLLYLRVSLKLLALEGSGCRSQSSAVPYVILLVQDNGISMMLCALLRMILVWMCAIQDYYVRMGSLEVLVLKEEKSSLLMYWQ